MRDKFMPPKIKHVLRDGTVLDTMEGFVLPINNETLAYYEIRAEQLRRYLKSKQAK